MKSLGIMLLALAAILAVAGGILILGGRWPFLGHLPGDIHVQGKDFTFHFPLMTCIVLSVLLTVLMNIFLRFMNR